MKIAFKEWGAICRALGLGEQIVILRKGGIAESGDAPDARLAVENVPDVRAERSQLDHGLLSSVSGEPGLVRRRARGNPATRRKWSGVGL